MGKKIDHSIPWYEQVPMKYWSMPSNLSVVEKQEKLDMIVRSHSYCTAEKKDGNWGRVVWEDGECILQSRTVSKKTGTYSDLTDKVLFMNKIHDTFHDTTVLLGEIYLPDQEATAKEVGVLLRCLPSKALERQKETPLHYYIFDCLAYEGEDLSETPMIERIQYVKKAAEAIDSPLVEYARYYEVHEDSFYDRLAVILKSGGEGMVLYKKTMLPCQDRTSAWETIKVKKELTLDVDVFISGIAAPEKEYKGKELPTWMYWQNTRTGEYVKGNYYTDYSQGGCFEPVSRNWFFGLPGSIECSVYNDAGQPLVLCYCSNLTDEFRVALRDDFERYRNKPAKISGMSISTDKDGNISIRHPKFLELRDDIDATDCQLSKILGTV